MLFGDSDDAGNNTKLVGLDNDLEEAKYIGGTFHGAT